MGRKSVKENKTVYQLAREELGLTREAASDLLEYISADRIEKIENEKTLARPEEVVTMSQCYKKPELCNYYCSHECPIGLEHVPEIKSKELSQIPLEMLSTLHTLSEEQNRLIEITVDGNITEDEVEDYKRIRDNLDKMALAIDSLKLWTEQTIASGKIDKSLLK